MKRRILYGAAGLLAIGNWVCDFCLIVYPLKAMATQSIFENMP